MKHRFLIVLCLLLLPFNVLAISQNWLESLSEYAEAQVDDVSLYYHIKKPQVYWDLANSLEKKIYLNSLGDNLFYLENDPDKLVILIDNIIEKTAAKLGLVVPETNIFLYPDQKELYRVTAYNDGFYVVMGNEVHVTPNDLYKVLEYVFAANYPNLERKLLMAMAKYYFPNYSRPHQQAQYWLNFQELPALSIVNAKTTVSLDYKDWDAIASFMGYLIETYPNLAWEEIKHLSDVETLLSTNLFTLEQSWRKYLQSKFYLKLARNEEVLVGQDAVGACLIENPGDPLNDVCLEIFNNNPHEATMGYVTQRYYEQLNSKTNELIRFKLSAPQKGAEEIWLIAKMSYTDASGKEDVCLFSLPIKIVSI